jgi:hypothetical protein
MIGLLHFIYYSIASIAFNGIEEPVSVYVEVDTKGTISIVREYIKT